MTDTADAGEATTPPDVTRVQVHVDTEVDGVKGSEELTVGAALRELHAMAPDVEAARQILKRRDALEAALVVALPLDGPQTVGPGLFATLVQPEGSREVRAGVFDANADRLVAMGLATKVEVPATTRYEHGGVKALTKPEALAALKAAGIEGLVAHKPGRKQLVFTHMTEEAA